MDARTYLQEHGTEGAEALVAALRDAGIETTVGYFKQIAYGHRRPSVDLAQAMVQHDPKKSLDFVQLLTSRAESRAQ